MDPLVLTPGTPTVLRLYAIDGRIRGKGAVLDTEGNEAEVRDFKGGLQSAIASFGKNLKVSLRSDG